MSGIHQVAHDKASVINAGGYITAGQHNYDDRRSVERIIVGAHDVSVHF